MLTRVPAPSDRAALVHRPPSAGLLARRTAVPAGPPGLLPRPSLDAALTAGVQARLTVVSAGPGWGKSTSVAAWAASSTRPFPVAWLTLEPDDNDPALFWTGVLHAIRATGVLHPDHPLARMTSIADVSPELMRTLLQGVFALPEPMVLALDEFHVIGDERVLDHLSVLLARRSPLRLVLMTRSDPLLRLHRLRLEGELVEVVADDLAFGPVDIAGLAARHGIPLDEEVADRIVRRTEGWPAGVRLALLHLARPGAPRDLSDFAGTSRSVAEYLVAEVLLRQPPDAQDFLLRSSVASAVTAELAEAITDCTGAARLLHDLEHDNLFVTSQGAEPRWYRYHPLLRQLLEDMLARDDRDRFRDAHRRAACWLQQHGDPVRALRHAVDAKDWGLFVSVFLRDAGPKLLGRHGEAISGLISDVPFEELPPTAGLEACAGALAFHDGRMAAVVGHAEAARRLLATTPESLRPFVAALADLLECAAARACGDAAGTVTATRSALQQLEGADSGSAVSGYRALATGSLAVGLLWSGAVAEARVTFESGIPLTAASCLDIPRLNAVGHLAFCEVLVGDLDSARSRAFAALEEASRLGLTFQFQLRASHLAAAFVAVLRGDAAEGDRHLLSAAGAVEGGVMETGLTAATHVLRALVEVDRDRPRAAQLALDQLSGVLADWQAPWFVRDWAARSVTEVALLRADTDRTDRSAALAALPLPAAEETPTVLACRARLALAGHDVQSAANAAQQVLLVGPDADDLSRIEGHLVLALCEDHQRREYEALEHLRRAVALAEEHQVRRPFVAARGERLPALLRLLDDVTRRRSPFIRGLLERLGGVRSFGPEPDPLVEALSSRELTVLALLPSMQSNEEIARQLFVSVNTVKAHLKGVYRKLGVNNRREAVHRARALSLLP